MSDRIDLIKSRMSSSAMNNMFIALKYLGTGNKIVPEVGKHYLFVYTPKTRNLKYDQHPLVTCTSIHRWGFCGINTHWDDYRRYTWQEVESNLYEIQDDEMDEASKLPLAFFRQT